MIVIDNMTLDAQMVFRDVQLDSRGHVAVLDAPLRQDDQLFGVISCLSIGNRQSWHKDEQAFVQLLANILALVMKDHRRSPRYSANCLITLLGPASGGAFLGDLSVYGCSIAASQPLEVGECLSLVIHLPMALAELSVETAVVRRVDYCRAGLEFVVMSAQEKTKLEVYVETLRLAGHPVSI
jgi:hypothetical protein